MSSNRNLTVGLLLACLFSGSVILRAAQEGRGEDIHFRGPVFAVSHDTQGRVVQLTIRVNQSQQNVVVTKWTDVIRGRGFKASRADLRLGDFVEVSGFFTTAARVIAQRIHLESQDGIELQGTVEAASGNVIRVSGIDFILDPSTFVHDSGAQTALSLASVLQGVPVRVRGSLDAGVWVAEEIEVGERTVESEPLRVSGVIREISGQTILLDVGIRLPSGTPVSAFIARVASTKVEGYLKPGLFIEVEGRFPPGQSYIEATRIAVDSNQNGNVFDDSSSDGAESEVELEGQVQQIQRAGDGSTKSFYVNQTLVRVQSQTEVRFRAGNMVENRRLQDGQPVEVEGTRLQDQSVLALRIEIQTTDPQGGPVTDPDDPGNGGSDDGGNGSGGEDSGKGGSTQPIDLDGIITSVSRLPDNSVESFELDGKTVVIVETTAIRGKESEVLSSSVLETGVRVKVYGEEQSDGTIVATRIELTGS